MELHKLTSPPSKEWALPTVIFHTLAKTDGLANLDCPVEAE